VGFSILSLDQSHDVKNFNCGVIALNIWLQNTSRQHQEKNISRTFVLTQDKSPMTIIGYYALAMRGLIPKESLPQNMQKALPLKVPAVTLARLAVSLEEQKRGHGERLLLNAMMRAKNVSNQIGGTLLFVDAKDTELLEFYIRYGFEVLPDDPFTLCMPISAIP
jgi:ribosomal protein S18 acetylase RimI-like enzyme